jgi:hypothetical protein
VTRDSAVLAFLCSAAATVASAQGAQFRGRILDETGSAVQGASITIVALGYSVRSDSSGTFSLTGTPGSTLSLKLRAQGYHDDSATVVFPRGGATSRDFVLKLSSTALPEVNPSDRVLRGRVTDTEGAPLSFANIQLNGGSRFISDDSGRFTVPHKAGRMWLLVRRIGFDPAELRLESMPDTAVRITMAALPTALPEQRVTGRAALVPLDLHGFYQRTKEYERGAWRGYFVTPEELELRRPNNLTAAVQYIPGVRVRPIPKTLDLWQNQRIEDMSRCPMTVYLDRIRIQPTMRRGQVVDEQVNLIALPTHLAGIEVYPGKVGAPPAYPAAPMTCGVVLVWTK